MSKNPVIIFEGVEASGKSTNIKNVSEISVGDTLTVTNNLAKKPLPGYQPIKPMVFTKPF